jgi:hypothetical protein
MNAQKERRSMPSASSFSEVEKEKVELSVPTLLLLGNSVFWYLMKERLNPERLTNITSKE